jgi:hypothetical protein
VNGADAFHPLLRETAAATGVVFSREVGYEPGTILAIAIKPDREGFVLALADDEGDSSAVGLTPEDATALRDALTELLAGEGA